MRVCDRCKEPLGDLIVTILRFELCLKCGQDIELWVLGHNHMLTKQQYEHYRSR